MRVVVFLALFLVQTTAVAAASVALVIGNDTYQEVTSLQKARADAQGYAHSLRARGFHVTKLEDLTGRDMRVELARFLDRIQPGDTVVFVYSGHGWSNGSINFLLPTDVGASGSESLIEAESLALRNGVNGVIDMIHRRGPGLTLAIIDACRNNPFGQGGDGTRSIGLSRGLSRVTAPTGTFIAFSAGEGQTALDRLSDSDTERYSVFTRHFLSAISQQQSLQQAFKQTQAAVHREAATIGHAQRPAYYDEVIGTACLSPGCDAVTAVEPAASVPATASDSAPAGRQLTPSAAEEWQDFKSSNSVAALELFATRHAGTAYGALARERIVALQSLPPISAAPVPVRRPNVSTVPQPSWCPRAKTQSEKAICSAQQLWELDADLTLYFTLQLGRLDTSQQRMFRAHQDAWLKQRDRCFSDVSCLVRAYEGRVDYLRK